MNVRIITRKSKKRPFKNTNTRIYKTKLARTNKKAYV